MEDPEPASLDVPKPIYALGRIAFVVNCSDAAFERALERLLPRPRVILPPIHDVCAGTDLRALTSNILALHTGCMWIDAACLLTPEGKQVLIAGHSGAGKSTTALALALRYDWQVLAEDITLIDPQKNVVIPFAAPFSLKPGTLQLLQESIGIVPDEVVLGEWVSLRDKHVQGEVRANYDLCLLFTPVEHGAAFKHIACTPAEYVRLVLSCSNLIHHAGGPDQFLEFIGSGDCYHIAGGTLAERLNFILGLVKNANTRKNNLSHTVGE